MAKVRVYELARELNMTNKALLGKLDELDIDVKSHMSSLDDPTVGLIKQKLFGREEKVDDVKVKPSVIRRRKAKKPETPAEEPEDTKESAPAEEKPEPEDELEIKEAPPEEPEESLPPQPETEEKEEETETPVLQAEEEEQEP
ncbi:MAG: translation initiation factor IF-2 N-terminal domain-containing protein, partial [Thermodesulfobacteriota bacterium]